MADLKDTAKMMLSSDYEERFIAEYIQTKIRYERLKAFNNKIEAAERMKYSGIVSGVELPEHGCPADLLTDQQNAMGAYLHTLEVRAVIEGVDIDGYC